MSRVSSCPARTLVLGLAVALLGGLAGWWVARLDASASAPRPPGGASQRLVARLELAGHGAWYGVTIDRPCTLRMRVDLPDGVATTLVWGRLGAGREDAPAHLPEPAVAERVPIVGRMAAPLERRPKALGPHVVFVEQPTLAMGDMGLVAEVEIEIVPDAR